MALPHNEQVRSVPLFDNLHLENSFEDNGVSGQQVVDLLALEDGVFQRCLSAQLAPAALQRCNRGRCAHQPSHCALFSQQPLDLMSPSRFFLH